MISNEEFEEWVEDAREQINSKRALEGWSVDDAVNQLKEKPSWRDEPNRTYLLEAAERIKKSLEDVRTETSPVTELKNGNDYHGGWYSPQESMSKTHWPKLAANIEKNLGQAAFKAIDLSSSRVIDALGDPFKDRLRTKGLVIGYVQSGKTTNFTSVIAKAADAGYRLIIVLTGLTDSLREQTQRRIDEDLIDLNPNKWHRLTTVDHDFEGDANAAKLVNRTDRFIAVIKKNQAPLRKLNDWIESAGDNRQGVPILIIDDEADQASINTANSKKAKEFQSRINRAIRDLTSHPRTSYVAYTATPFANILIDSNDQEDLYPKDFIQVLEYPHGYFGAAQLFGRDILAGEDPDEVIDDSVDAIRLIADEEIQYIRPPARDVEGWEACFVDSLRDATYWFLIATSIRRMRKDEDVHSSMLIHTSPRIGAHRVMHDELKHEIGRLIAEIQSDKAKDSLRSFFDREITRAPLNPEYLAPRDFDELWIKIKETAKRARLVIDNGKSDERLNYEESVQTVIAIGGGTLSRGLTLEGLVSSYFARTTQTYDTLLQMGRWFGFRNGYEDLVRIWLPEHLRIWYRDLATIEEDLRREIAYYEIEGKTPLEMKARIRCHPDMEVTSRAKQQSKTTRSMSFSGQRIQTISFKHKDRDWIKNNTDAAKDLIAQATRLAGEPFHEKRNNSFVFRNLDSDIILNFLDDYKFDDVTVYSDQRMSLLRKYIKDETKSNSLRSWNISVIGQRANVKGSIDLGLPKEINLINRSKIQGSAQGHANINTLVSPQDRMNDVTFDPDERKEFQQQFKEVPKEKKDAFLRYKHEELAGKGIAHLVIYAISKDSEPMRSSNGVSNLEKMENKLSRTRVKLEAVDHLIGVGIFFPESQTIDGSVTYISGVDDVSEEVLAETEALVSEFEQGIVE